MRVLSFIVPKDCLSRPCTSLHLAQPHTNVPWNVSDGHLRHWQISIQHITLQSSHSTCLFWVFYPACFVQRRGIRTPLSTQETSIWNMPAETTLAIQRVYWMMLRRWKWTAKHKHKLKQSGKSLYYTCMISRLIFISRSWQNNLQQIHRWKVRQLNEC